MGQIGEHCKQLVDLNVSGTPITDRGLIQLCVAEDGTRRCQKLARLSVNETWITSKGATVVLQSLPNLRDFDFDNIFEVHYLIKFYLHVNLKLIILSILTFCYVKKEFG